MKVLVTGGCGLIGYHAATYYINKGDNVTVIDNLERSKLLGHDEVSDARRDYNKIRLENLGVKIYEWDISDQRTVGTVGEHEGPFDTIIHLAAQCGVPTSIENPRRDFEVNVIGTFNVLEYAREFGSTVVFASTNKVYPIHEGFIEKEDRWHFQKPDWDTYGFPVVTSLIGSRTPYGWSKYSADNLCQEYYHTYGVKTGVFRMSCIYGTHQFGFEEQGWATWFVIATEKDLPITIFGDGKQVRDMLYVEDTIKAYDAFVESDLEHGVFNLGGGPTNTLSLNECLKKLTEITGKTSKVELKDWRPSDQKVYISDIRPIKIALDWEPTVGPDEGLKKIHDWVKEAKVIF